MTTRLSTLIALGAVATSAFLGSPGQANEVDDLAARGVILRTRDVREGMRGIGKTVFRGTRIDTFDVEILSVMEHRTDSGGDMILIKVLSGPVVERKCGIIAGMSGSPVYVDGKLIGAIAYGWPGSLEPIGGVSPIEEMLASFEPKEPPKPANQVARLSSPLKVADRTFTKVAVRGSGDLSRAGASGDTLELRPIATPILVNGFRQESFPALKKVLEPYGLEPVQGAGGRMSGVEASVEPGAAIGVDLVSGDLSISAGGTLTYRDGDRVLAFGHPFLGTGTGLCPLTTAYVHEILPHLNRSFKLLSSVKTVGAVTQDWVAGIGGVLGRQAPMIPVRVVTRDPERGRERTFNFSVVNHKELTSDLVVSAALDACYAGFGSQTDGTLKMEMRAEGQGIKPIVRRNVFYTRGEVLMPAVFELADAVVNLSDNPFQRVDLTKLELSVELVRKRSAAEIQRVTVSPSRVKPGDQIHVGVVLEPKDGKPETRTATFTVPKDTPGGTLRVGVAGGGFDLYLRSRLGLYLPRVTTLDELLWLWDQVGSNSELRVKVALPNVGAAVGSQQLPALPASVLQVMQSTRTTGVLFPLRELAESFDTEWDISGRPHLVTVQVVGKRPSSSPPSRPPSPPPSPPPPESPDEVRPALALADGRSERPRVRLWHQLEQLGLLGREGSMEPMETAPGQPAPEEPAAPAPGEVRPPAGPPPSGPPGKPQPQPKQKREGVARPTETWRVAGVKGFLEGENHNSCVTSAGDLRIAPASRKLFSADDLYVWCLAAAPDGAVYAGLGNGGQIHRIDPTGRSRLLVETAAAGVYALTVTKSGALIAGLSPGARIVRIDDKGAQSLLCDLDEEYVWSLFWEADDTLLIATGSQGRVYRLKLGGKPEVAYDLPQRHVRRLARDGKGTLYAGTADLDVLYKLGKEGSFETLAQSSDGEILGLVPGDGGTLFYAVARKGDIYKRLPSGRVEAFFESSQTGAYDMVRDAEGNFYLATTGPTAKGIVYKVDPEGAGMRVLEPEEANALCLALSDKGKLLVGLGNGAAVHELALAGNSEALYESEVYDAQRVSQWGTVVWTAQTPAGCSVALEFRSGNTEEPDETWSPWQRPLGAGSVWTVPCPASRFLQFQVHLQSESGKATPRLQAVEVVYLPRNQAPQVSLKEPVSGARWSGAKQVTWSGSDPDGDPLAYKLFTSADDGSTWQAAPLKDPKKTDLELDTKKLKDGIYRIKVEASDEGANPGQGLTGEIIGDPFAVDNKAPFVVLSTETRTDKGKSVVLRATAVDQMSRVGGADFRIDGGEWQATRAADGIFDSSAEDIEFQVSGLSGKHKAELRVRDEAGNLTTKEREYEFPAKDQPVDDKQKQPAKEPAEKAPTKGK